MRARRSRVTFAIESPEFLPSIVGATDTPFLPGNRVDVLNNGDEFYPSMLEAIHGARRTITIEAYIYWAGDIGRRFAEVLAAKAREGVTVKVLLDAVGSATISDDIVDTFVTSGSTDTIASRVVARYGDIVERVSFDTSGRLDADRVATILAGFR